MSTKKANRRERIKRSIRSKISGTADRPRLTVFRSNSAIYAQIINDDAKSTIASATSYVKGNKSNSNVESAKKVGLSIAEKAKAAGINSVVFDRNGYLYHGKVKSLAEGAREGGLQF